LGSGQCKIVDEFTTNIAFSQLNLVSDNFSSSSFDLRKFDFIFCRNVFIYFEPERIQKIIEKFWHCLKPGGFLVLGICEAQIGVLKGFSSGGEMPIGVFRRENDMNFQNKPLIKSVGKKNSPIETGAQSILQRKPKTLKPTSQLTKPRSNPKNTIESEDNFKERIANLLQKGRYVELIAALKNYDGFQESHFLMFQKAKSEFFLGDYSQALKSVEQAISLLNTIPCYHYLKGLILIEQNKFLECQKPMRTVLYLDENNLSAYLTLSNVMQKIGNKIESKRLIRLAYEISINLDENFIVPDSDGMTVHQFRMILSEIIKNAA
jgi:chemotaxis protein methyltransferase CheR